MPKNNRKENPLSNYDRFGIVSSLIGLVADVLALATFGFSLANGTEKEASIGIVLWLGILSIIPLLYSWGFLAWLANSKFGKTPISVVLTGIILSPLYIFWGAIVLAESVPTYIAGYYKVTSESRAQGGLMAFALQLGIGLIILFVLMLWNKLIEQEANNKTRL